MHRAELSERMVRGVANRGFGYIAKCDDDDDHYHYRLSPFRESSTFDSGEESKQKKKQKVVRGVNDDGRRRKLKFSCLLGFPAWLEKRIEKEAKRN